MSWFSLFTPLNLEYGDTIVVISMSFWIPPDSDTAALRNVLIYQVDNGADNGGRLPSGGVLWPGSVASSMSVTVANPITFYANSVINQDGQSGDLYNYYWTSYSRGTDGKSLYGEPNLFLWHNLYLDSYIPLKHKSIYDPCPYGYRIPSNGTYNEFVNTGWKNYSYAGGAIWKQSWFNPSGYRPSHFSDVGYGVMYKISILYSANNNYVLYFRQDKSISSNYPRSNTEGGSVRCIEE